MNRKTTPTPSRNAALPSTLPADDAEGRVAMGARREMRGCREFAQSSQEVDEDVSECEGLVEVEAGVSVVGLWKEDVVGAEMTAEDARSSKAIVARLNYMAGDRPDMQYAVKEMARSM